jgi:hypothetical protein
MTIKQEITIGCIFGSVLGLFAFWFLFWFVPDTLIPFVKSIIIWGMGN